MTDINIDYKEILFKYIKLIVYNEGIDYIPKNLQSYMSLPRDIGPFTQKEVEVLWKLTGWNEKEGKYK